MKFHPYSEIFPLIEGAEFEALAEDIKTHGLRERIWVYGGKILDGRNRFLACKKAKVKPQTRTFRGSDSDALAFVWSLNASRRHLNASQLGMAAARRANLSQGQKKADAQNCASVSQIEAATDANVSRRTVQAARKVLNEGSVALQKAVESGELSVSKAASVVDLPKSEQLNAATQKPEPSALDEPERPDDVDEDAAIAAAEADLTRRVDAVMRADDKLAAAHAQLKQQAALIGTLEATRDGYMRGKEAVTKMLQVEQRKTTKLEKENAKLREQVESLNERVAIMEQAA